MRIRLTVRKAALQRLFQIPRPNVESLLMLDKRTVARWIFYVGILIAFYGTLNPWFVWPISRYVHYLAAIPIALSLMYSHNLKQGIFNRKDYLYPFLACVVLQLVMALASGKNINGLMAVAFSSLVYFALLKVDIDELRRLGDMLTKSMACILAVSIPFYILHLIGFSLPHYHVAPAEFEYTFENYRFFLIDDRQILELLPRFHSVFLEPSHLGMACIGLLYSQIGKWKTWRCRILFFAIILSFSLAAYICMVVMMFSASWMRGKAILGKILLLVALFATVVIASIFYNKGENIVNVMIVQRLTVNSEGQLEGDNRTDYTFTREYEKMAESGDIFFGKGMEAMERFGGTGNSGYRVFLYINGLVSVIFLLVFFFLIFRTSDNTRAKITMSIISLLSFVAHGIPIKYYFFIPLYVLIFSEVYPQKRERKKNTPAITTSDGSN